MSSTFHKPNMSRKQAAEYLGLAENTLARWACDGTNALPFTKVGFYARYSIEDLEEWLASRRVTQTT